MTRWLVVLENVEDRDNPRFIESKGPYSVEYVAKTVAEYFNQGHVLDVQTEFGIKVRWRHVKEDGYDAHRDGD